MEDRIVAAVGSNQAGGQAHGQEEMGQHGRHQLGTQDHGSTTTRLSSDGPGRCVCRKGRCWVREERPTTPPVCWLGCWNKQARLGGRREGKELDGRIYERIDGERPAGMTRRRRGWQISEGTSMTVPTMGDGRIRTARATYNVHTYCESRACKLTAVPDATAAGMRGRGRSLSAG